jgi:hypothetical protein
MNIRSTRQYLAPNTTSRQPVPEPGESPISSFNDSWSVPRWISKPRSAISSADNLLQAADNFGWTQNPIPASAQTAISALGAGFAAVNVGAELLDGDFKGALWDIGNGAVSLTIGAKLLGLPANGVLGMFAAGAALNSVLAVEQFRKGEVVEGCLRSGSVTGISLTVAGGLVGGSLGATLGSAGMALRGAIGLASLVHDLTDDKGFLNRPDRFS